MNRSFEEGLLNQELKRSTQEEISTVRSRTCRSLKFCNIHRKMSVLESLLKKVAFVEALKSVEGRLQNRFVPVNIVELRHFFSFWYITLKFMQIVWHKYNLLIFLSVNSGHPGVFIWDSPWILIRVREPLGEN